MTERTRKALDLVIKARRNLSNSTEEEALDFILNCVYAMERLPLEKQSLFALFGLVREPDLSVSAPPSGWRTEGFDPSRVPGYRKKGED